MSEKQLSAFAHWFNRTQFEQGSFAVSLFETFLKGSQPNREKLEIAFPDYFNKGDYELNF